MPTNKPNAGKSPAIPEAKPAVPDERIDKALKEIEELQKQLAAKQEALDAREKELNAKADEMMAKKQAARVETAEEAKAYETKAQKMKSYLWSQPLIRMMIPLEPGEKDGTVYPITLNGYRLNIRKNTYVEIPKPVADIIGEILLQNEAAGREFRLDLPRAPKDGINVTDALM